MSDQNLRKEKNEDATLPATFDDLSKDNDEENLSVKKRLLRNAGIMGTTKIMFVLRWPASDLNQRKSLIPINMELEVLKALSKEETKKEISAQLDIRTLYIAFIYAAGFIFSYFTNKFAIQKRFGNDLDQLKKYQKELSLES